MGQGLCSLRDAAWGCWLGLGHSGVLTLLAILYFYNHVTACIISCHVTPARNVNGPLIGMTDGITASFMVLFPFSYSDLFSSHNCKFWMFPQRWATSRTCGSLQVHRPPKMGFSSRNFLAKLGSSIGSGGCALPPWAPASWSCLLALLCVCEIAGIQVTGDTVFSFQTNIFGWSSKSSAK